MNSQKINLFPPGSVSGSASPKTSGSGYTVMNVDPRLYNEKYLALTYFQYMIRGHVEVCCKFSLAPHQEAEYHGMLHSFLSYKHISHTLRYLLSRQIKKDSLTIFYIPVAYILHLLYSCWIPYYTWFCGIVNIQRDSM